MKKINLKKITFVFLFIFCANSFMIAQLKTISNGKQIDEKLVGIWVGSEKDKQIEGVSKSWEMTRNVDGTFVLDFQFTQNGNTQNTQETGNWWVENGKFYEYHAESDLTDIYVYKPMGTKRVKFKAAKMNVDMNADTYEFIDTRKVSPPRITDGLSLKNAIKVKSVPEEYEYVRKVCKGCQMKNQAITENGNRYYDILTLIKPDGTEISYYFDVTSFYGKW